ncbi:glutamyl-tRNA(Gln) amidotransferase subunit A [Clostridia bacterium]|nr:glutamyl-tRNA(Gln) amidotransferase subunit A [Clostridia bacterium]
MDIRKMTALELGAAIKRGEISPAEAVKYVLEAAASVDKTLNAYVSLYGDEAISAAESVSERIKESASPLAGVPLAVKDNICTKGIVTTCASKILGGFVPPYDATVIERAVAAGMIPAGKLNMDEFAMGSTSETSYSGIVRNPWNTDNVPGGSSGGAAAAVAGGEAVIALGSDTGGSIRQPASYCGVTGFKPTYGRVSRYGLIAYASSLDQIGPVAKDAADCAALMDIVSGSDLRDSTSIDAGDTNFLGSLSGDIKGKRIGLPRECFESKGLSTCVKDKVEAFAKTLENLGASVEYISLPFLDYVIPAYYIIAAAEASSNLSRFDGVKYGYRAKEYAGINDLYAASRSEGFGFEVKKRILLGTFVLSSGYYDAYYQKALKVKSVIKKGFDEAFKQVDLIVCPTAPTTAPRLGESLKDPLAMYLSDIFTVSVNLAGLPAISVPCGFDSSGMPVGAQIIGNVLADSDVLNAGYSYQQATDYHRQYPGGKA